MSEPTRPVVPRSVHPLTQWLDAIEQAGETPNGFPIRQIRWTVGVVEEVLTYLFAVDGFAAGVVTAGVPPVYLGPGPEAGTAWFQLTPPCVVFSWFRAPRERLQGSALVVIARSKDRRTHQQGYQPTPALMRALTALVHQPKPEQQRQGSPPPGPQQSSPDGRDPNGEA